MVAVLGGQAGAGVVDEAGWTVGDVDDGGNDVGGLAFPARVPELLGVPGASAGREVEVLIAHPPAAVAAFDDVDPAGLVAAVGVVVAGKQIAEVVEGEFLGISQAGGVDFEVRPVRLAAEDRAAIRSVEVLAFLRRDVQAAVADGEIEPPVRAHLEAVEVVAEEGDVDAVAGAQGFLDLGLAVAVLVPQSPEVGDAGVEDVPFAGEQAGADAVGGVLEAIGEDGRVVGLAVAVAVLYEPHALVLDIVRLKFLGAEELLVHRHAVGHGLRGHVDVEPVHVAAVVGDAVVEPKRLGDEEPPTLVDAERHRIGQVRLAREQFELQAGGQADRLRRHRRLGRRPRHLRLVKLVVAPRRGHRDDQTRGERRPPGSRSLHEFVSSRSIGKALSP